MIFIFPLVSFIFSLSLQNLCCTEPDTLTTVWSVPHCLPLDNDIGTNNYIIIPNNDNFNFCEFFSDPFSDFALNTAASFYFESKTYTAVEAWAEPHQPAKKKKRRYH